MDRYFNADLTVVLPDLTENTTRLNSYKYYT